MTVDVTGGAGSPAPPDVPSGSPPRGGRVAAVVFNVRVLRIAGQVAAIVVLLLLAVSVFSAHYAAENPWSHPWIFNYWTSLGWIKY